MPTTASGIADYLQSLGFGTKGTDIHQSVLRDEPDDAIIIMEGAGQGAQRSHDLRRVRNPGVAITVRAAKDKFDEGYEKAHAVYDAMLVFSNTAFGGVRYLGANPLGDVSDSGRDERDRWKWSMNFVVKKS